MEKNVALLKWTSIAWSLMLAVSVPAGTETNLCYNGNFDSANGALDGWYVDYRWMGNSNFMKNHEYVSVLPSYQGKRNVLWVNPPVQARVESKLIPIEKGVRYKCTLELNAPDVRFYFNGYKWEPGIAPHPEPHLKELRRIYKGEPYTGGSGGGWKTISFYLPLEELSETAWDHYKDVRFATVYMTRYRGGFHVANVRVTKLPGTYKVKNAPAAKPTPPVPARPLPKPMPLPGAAKSGPINDDPE